jgi:hypothetical protein
LELFLARQTLYVGLIQPIGVQHHFYIIFSSRDTIGPRQGERLSLELDKASSNVNQEVMDFVSEKLRAVLTGEKIETTFPPQVRLLATSAVKVFLPLCPTFLFIVSLPDSASGLND